jgi:hypothetical protein
LDRSCCGYGSQKKEVTGAVSTVDSKTLEILKPVKDGTSLTELFLVLMSTSGAPGAKLDIRIKVLLQTEKTDQQQL